MEDPVDDQSMEKGSDAGSQDGEDLWSEHGVDYFPYIEDEQNNSSLLNLPTCKATRRQQVRKSDEGLRGSFRVDRTTKHYAIGEGWPKIHSSICQQGIKMG
jgi:hypothetical protein